MNTRRTPDLDDLDPDQREAVIAFRNRNGRNWKEKLTNHWWAGTDANQPMGALLRQVRNQFGPEWLSKLKD